MRSKPFLTYFILCAIPLLLLAALNYWNGIRTANTTLSTIVQNDLNSFNFAVDQVLKERGQDILGLTIKGAVQDLLSNKQRNEIDLGDFSQYFQSLTLFTNDRKPLCFQKGPGEWTFSNIDAANLPQADQQLFSSPGNVLVKSAGSTPETIIYSAPVNDKKTGANLGAVVGLVDLKRVFATATRGMKSRSNKVVITDRAGKTIYSSNS